MTLYTIDQVKVMLSKARMHNIDDSEMFTDDYLIEQQTPIELPSDEEEEKAAMSMTKNIHQHIGFNMGVEWMRYKIKQKQLITEIMQADEKDGLYDESKTNNL